MSNLNRKLASAFAVSALAASISVGPSAASAAAATARCRLSISASFVYQSVKYNRVTNICTPADARDRMVQSIMWGADWPDNDDFQYSRSPVLLNETYTVPTVWLNEDRVTGDEVYTENRFVRPNGSIYTVKSNEVHGDFWPF